MSKDDAVPLFVVLGFIGVFALTITFCLLYRNNEAKKVENIFKGEHKLRKMAERSEQYSEISGGFFLIAGSLSGKGETITTIKFAWEMNEGTYAISSLPLEKIRVKFNNNVEIPTIYFQSESKPDYYDELQKMLNHSILYAVVTCKESDWPVQIQLPLNK